MSILDEIENAFGTRNLYEVLGVEKSSSHEQIKKAYRKTSLKVHPDRVSEEKKDEFTRKFQTLAQVHYVLSDNERRKMYDDYGIIMNEDSLDSEANWVEYWRLLFPKITTKDIQGFIEKYQGSDEEKEDLKKYYNQYKGDMDKISQCHITFDEDRTRKLLEEMISNGQIESFDKFVNEPENKREKRRKRAVREAKQAEKAKKKHDQNDDESLSDLTALIRGKQKNCFDSMIANLEAKYAKKSSAPKGQKRKRSEN